ncbi:hypothetical protein BDR05DRAFT_953503 [Suillus weaverae]|nr:hypothetical protein BDR05DRAFT_953503 [Suillus weaverae]
MTYSKHSTHQRKVAIATVDVDSGPPGVPSDDKVEVTKSPLYISLLGCALSHGAFTADTCSYDNINIPEENNHAPCIGRWGIRRNIGSMGRLGPYFNLFDSGIDVSNLKKTQAQFKLHFLAPEDEDNSDYPQEALDMSCRVLNTLSALTTAVEDRCNAGVPEAEHPAVSPFSEPLFKDLPKEGATTTPRISRQDIGKLGILLSPNGTFLGKAKQLAQASAAVRSSCAANTSGSGCNVACSSAKLAEFLCIRDLHDPDNRYSGLGLLKEMKVECPDVCDGNGLLIHLREYSIKLAHAWFVKVKMQLLSSMGYAKADVLKGKRKASEELTDPLQAKKLAVASGGDDSMDEL